MLTKVFQPLMFAGEGGEGGSGGEGGAGGEGAAGSAGGEGGSGAGAGAGGGAATPWNSNLDVDLKEHPSVTKAKTLNDFVKSSLERDKLIGRKGIILPVEGSSEAEINQFYNELGRPETVEGYKADDIKPPEGVKIDETVRASFLSEAHKLGLTQKQVSGLMAWQLKGEGVRSKASVDERTALLHKVETDLRSEYGVAYDANISKANKVVDAFADENAREGLSEALGHDPRMIRMMVNIANAMGEDSLGKALPSAVKTPAEADKEIAQIKENKKHPYNIKAHPEHQKAVEYVSSLYDMKHPNERK
jgi:hypothetical protein